MILCHARLSALASCASKNACARNSGALQLPAEKSIGDGEPGSDGNQGQGCFVPDKPSTPEVTRSFGQGMEKKSEAEEI